MMRLFLIYAGFIPFSLPVIFLLMGISAPLPPEMWLYIIQIYGGIILSFLAGIQWGLSFQQHGDKKYTDFILPIWSNIIAIAAFLSLIQHKETTTLSILIFGFLAQLLADMHFARKGFYAAGYMKHRVIITVFVVSALLLVLRNIVA